MNKVVMHWLLWFWKFEWGNYVLTAVNFLKNERGNYVLIIVDKHAAINNIKKYFLECYAFFNE